jgi:hypothetical protein
MFGGHVHLSHSSSARVPCWQPSTALTNPHTTAPNFVDLIFSINLLHARERVISCYICAAVNPRAAVYFQWTCTNQCGRLTTVLGVLLAPTGPNSKSTSRSIANREEK